MCLLQGQLVSVRWLLSMYNHNIGKPLDNKSCINGSKIDKSYFIGWDIGGAHLKAVVLDSEGNFVDSIQLVCPLWRGLNNLEQAILDALRAFVIAPSRARHAITMTGELVDLFESRHDGVCKIAQVATEMLGEQVLFYAAHKGFVQSCDVQSLTSIIASANWFASVSVLALKLQSALFVDIGSTTTDIIAIVNGKIISQGISDAHRLQADSLVYTGIVRTPVMALAQKLTFENTDAITEFNVAAEYFATMADVYRLTGELTENADVAETADGKGKTQLESARRLARMVGHDVDCKKMEDDHLKNWIKLAFTCRHLQMQQIKTAMLKHLKPHMTIIGAGAGSFLVKAIATELNHSYIPASELVSSLPSKPSSSQTQHAINVCFPAFAVAFLSQKNLLTENNS